MAVCMTVVTYGLDNPEITKMALRHLRANSDPSLTSIVLVDNGSTVPYEQWDADQLVRYEENTGGNAVFHRLHNEGLVEPAAITAFFHCDMMILEPRWDHRVVRAFQADDQLGLLGFVGSNEIDWRGGRGDGTMLNFAGLEYPGYGRASHAEQHGKRIHDLRPGAVLDHCSMVFRTSTLRELPPQEGNFAPEHFYDRILCCAVLERGERVGVFGIICDHFSGGIGPGEARMDPFRRKWLASEGIVPNTEQSLSLQVYLESERRFLTRYRDTGFIPLRVNPDWSITHDHAARGGWWRPDA